MADFVAPPSVGFHFSLPGYPNCVIAFYDTLGAGQCCSFGVGEPGSILYEIQAVLWGPQWIDSSKPAGETLASMGISQAASQAIQRFLSTPKQAPAVQGTDLATEPNLNTALGQYYAINDHNQMVQVPFP